MPKKPFRKSSTKNKRRRVYPKLSFKKRVLSLINQQAEMKTAFMPLNLTLGNTINTTSGIFGLEPTIPVGDLTYNRVGNKIRLHKMEIVGFINWKPLYTSTEFNGPNSVINCNNIVRFSVLRQRSHESGSTVATSAPTYFEANNILESSNAYTGTLQNCLTDFNKDAFVVKKDLRLKMSGSLTYQGGVVNIDSSSTMLRKIRYTMRFGKAGKVLRYRSSGVSIATNFPYFLTLVAHNSLDGTVASNMFSELQVKFYYTDI